MIVGVIADTHGLLRPQAFEALRGSQLIIHAGDVGAEEILDQLARVAPLRAVRGNVDKGAWAKALPLSDVVEAAGVQLYVMHNLKELDLSPQAAGFTAVIAGHSHQPAQRTRDGVLYFNPGSAGPRRFHLPVSLGKLHIANGKVRGEIVNLAV